MVEKSTTRNKCVNIVLIVLGRILIFIDSTRRVFNCKSMQDSFRTKKNLWRQTKIAFFTYNFFVLATFSRKLYSLTILFEIYLKF